MVAGTAAEVVEWDWDGAAVSSVEMSAAARLRELRLWLLKMLSFGFVEAGGRVREGR